MRVVTGIILVIVYLTIGYVVSAVIDTLEDQDVEERFECWVLWPFLLTGYLTVKLVLWIGRRIAVWPLVFTELFKISVEKNAERRRKREVRRLMKELGYAEAEHDGKSGKGR